MTLICGICQPPQTCGGGGSPNVCGCTPVLEPNPKDTTPNLVRIYGNPIIIIRNNYAHAAQTFVAPGPFNHELQAIELAGMYTTGQGKETITITLYDEKGPDGTVIWTQTYLLQDTRFREVETAKPAYALPNVFVVDQPFKIIAGSAYWIVVTTSAQSVFLLDYDGQQLGGNAINPGDLYFEDDVTPWRVVPRTDMHVVVNPCQSGTLPPQI
jgi:hypothetical protein